MRSLATRDFRRALYAESGNPLLTRMPDELRDQAALVSAAAWRRDPLSWARESAEHHAVLVAATAGDAAGGALAAGVMPGARAPTAIRSGENSRAAARAGAGGKTPADAAADRIVASVRRPHFSHRYFPVTDFGAVGDGAALNTRAFAAAIAACNRAGGGHVVVPSGGTFLTGAIHLRSNVDLHVEQGATILFSQDPNDYLPSSGSDGRASS